MQRRTPVNNFGKRCFVALCRVQALSWPLLDRSAGLSQIEDSAVSTWMLLGLLCSHDCLPDMGVLVLRWLADRRCGDDISRGGTFNGYHKSGS